MERIQYYALKALLELREGRVERVYRDHLGYPTAGVGHLLTRPEKSLYKVGDPVPSALVDEWFEKDSERFIKLTAQHLSELGIVRGYREFCIALCSANFQLGNFKVKFPNTWERLKQGKYREAITAIRASLWCRQTPVRTEDFCKAILTLDPETAQEGREHFERFFR